MARQRIIVGVDGSSGSRRAVEWAVDECRLRGCSLLVSHTLDTRQPRPIEGGPAALDYDDAAEYLLSEHASAASVRQPGVPVTTLLNRGLPADVLVELSTGAELVVLGTRGGNGFTSTMLGSVSHRTAVHAHSPVAVVPQRRPQAENADGPRVVAVGVAGGRAGLSTRLGPVPTSVLHRAPCPVVVVGAMRAPERGVRGRNDIAEVSR